jgi:hypothetical protein
MTNVAFSVTNVQSPARCEGFRVYPADDRLYFIAVNNLAAISQTGQDARLVVGQGNAFRRHGWGWGGGWDWSGWLPFMTESSVGGWDAWRIAEQTPLEQRVKLHPDNFFMLYVEFLDAVIAPTWSWFWQTYGRWTFTHPHLGPLALDFYTGDDLLIAMNCLPKLLGKGLQVQGRFNPRTRQLE